MRPTAAYLDKFYSVRTVTHDFFTMNFNTLQFMPGLQCVSLLPTLRCVTQQESEIPHFLSSLQAQRLS
jgi:hypothetical protein